MKKVSNMAGPYNEFQVYRVGDVDNFFAKSSEAEKAIDPSSVSFFQKKLSARRIDRFFPIHPIFVDVEL